MKYHLLKIFGLGIGRSRKGAWIEINLHRDYRNTPLGRSRKGAWIEMQVPTAQIPRSKVAPARERGLKFERSNPVWYSLYKSLPQGSVD